MTLAGADVIAFVATTDAGRALAFYRDVLGLSLTNESPFALAFDAHGTMLRVTIVERLTPAPYAVLGWAVSDIAAEIDALAARGVAFLRYPGLEQDERGVWSSPSGARVAWFADPEGNTLSLTQL